MPGMTITKRTGGGGDNDHRLYPVYLSALAIEQLAELATEALDSYVQDGAHRDHLERGQRALGKVHLDIAQTQLARDIAEFEGRREPPHTSYNRSGLSNPPRS